MLKRNPGAINLTVVGLTAELPHQLRADGALGKGDIAFERIQWVLLRDYIQPSRLKDRHDLAPTRTFANALWTKTTNLAASSAAKEGLAERAAPRTNVPNARVLMILIVGSFIGLNHLLFSVLFFSKLNDR